MSSSIRREVLDLGNEIVIPSGSQVDRDLLDGRYVFVITRGVASHYHRSVDGRISDVRITGREGMFPLAGLLDVPAMPMDVVSQIGDLHIRKVRTDHFHRAVCHDDRACAILRKFIYTVVSQLGSNVVSAEQNCVQARVARWLLMCHDRVPGDSIEITHDALASMAFSHRPTITNTLHAMEGEHLIRLSRGSILMRSREGLRALAGGSYGVAEDYWARELVPLSKDVDAGEPWRLSA